ncbi:hypothetical protein [Mycobacterium sp.]|uniref:hypothetical protein n=1 Tax=Mycobacterium sp. TaxID=1785 RepID=UPI0031CF2A9D
MLGDGLFRWRAQHPGGVDPVLLSELSGICRQSALVEDILYGLEDILRVWCRSRICVLLAVHDHVHDFADLHRG